MRGFVQRTLALKPVYLRRRSGLVKIRNGEVRVRFTRGGSSEKGR